MEPYKAKSMPFNCALSNELIKLMSEANEGYGEFKGYLRNMNYDYKCFISHSDCLEDAEAVKKQVELVFPYLIGKVKIYSIGTIIGSHSGPGTVALFFVGEERK